VLPQEEGRGRKFGLVGTGRKVKRDLAARKEKGKKEKRP